MPWCSLRLARSPSSLPQGEPYAGAETTELPQSLTRKPADEQGYKLRNLRIGEVLERLTCYEVNGLFRHETAILGLDVAYLGGDLLENNGIESSLHLTEDRPPTITTSATA